MKSMKKNKLLLKKNIAIILIASGLMGIGGYAYINTTTNEPQSEELVSRERSYPVKRGDITVGTSGAGLLKFEQTTQNFEDSVVIDELFVTEGQSIKKGDRIASISEQFIEDKLKELNSQLEQTTANLKSATNNKEATILTQNKTWEDTVQTSKTQYEDQKNAIVNDINHLKEKINDCTTKINDLTRQIEELSNQSTENEAKIQEFTLQQNSLEEQTVSDETNESGETNGNEVEIDEIKNQIEEISNYLIENEAKIEALKAEISLLETEKLGVETELNIANSSLSNLDSEREKQLKQESESKKSNDEINALSNSGLSDSIKSAQADVDKIKEEIAKVNKMKENSTLYAESDGIVLALNYVSGATTIKEQPVVAIGKEESVVAQVTVSQENITKLEEGQLVNLSVSAFQDAVIKGKVKSLNLKPTVQGNSTNYSVTIEIDENDYRLLDGMTVNAQFIVKEVKDVLMLSNKAITLKDGKQIVNVKQEDGTYKELEINTGFSDGKNTEIVSGLSEGDIVVIGG